MSYLPSRFGPLAGIILSGQQPCGVARQQPSLLYPWDGVIPSSQQPYGESEHGVLHPL